MARKRTRLANSDDDDDDEFVQLSGSDASEYTESKRTSTKKNKQTPKKGSVDGRRITKRVNVAQSLETDDEETNVELVAVATDSDAIPPHSQSVHTLTNPEPLKHALLEWYKGVHAARGMPWRKPFDPNWDAEQRAQRAYEVNCTFSFLL